MPRWKELKRFCDRDGWELYKETDHYKVTKLFLDDPERMIGLLIGQDEKDKG